MFTLLILFSPETWEN